MKKTALFSVLSFVLVATPVGRSLRADDFTTLDGDKYTNATVKRVEPDGILIGYSDGVVKLNFKNLPPEAGRKYGYNPEKAALYQKIKQGDTLATLQQAQLSHSDDVEVKQALAQQREIHLARLSLEQQKPLLEQQRQAEEQRERGTREEYEAQRTTGASLALLQEISNRAEEAGQRKAALENQQALLSEQIEQARLAEDRAGQEVEVRMAAHKEKKEKEAAQVEQRAAMATQVEERAEQEKTARQEEAKAKLEMEKRREELASRPQEEERGWMQRYRETFAERIRRMKEWSEWHFFREEKEKERAEMARKEEERAELEKMEQRVKQLEEKRTLAMREEQHAMETLLAKQNEPRAELVKLEEHHVELTRQMEVRVEQEKTARREIEHARRELEQKRSQLARINPALSKHEEERARELRENQRLINEVRERVRLQKGGRPSNIKIPLSH